jgi:hypothetical protein
MNAISMQSGTTRRGVLEEGRRRQPRRPSINILWLMFDQHNPFIAGHAEDAVVKTTAIAASNRTFPNRIQSAYV